MRVSWGPALFALLLAPVALRAQDPDADILDPAALREPGESALIRSDGLPSLPDLSGTWRVSPTADDAGSVRFSSRQRTARTDRYVMRVELPARSMKTFEVTFDGSRLAVEGELHVSGPATSAGEETPTVGAIGFLEGRSAPAASAPTPTVEQVPAPREEGPASWLMQTRHRGRGRPSLQLFQAERAGQGLPRSFARRMVSVEIEGERRLGVRDEAGYQAKVTPVEEGSFAWSAEPADAVTLAPEGALVRVTGRRPGQVTLTCAFASSSGDETRASRVLEVLPAIEEVKLVSISYLSDHGLLRDHDADWSARGDLIREPEWTPARQRPISHTMGKPVTLRVELQVGPPGAAPTRVTLKGDGPGKLDFEREVELAPGKVTLELTSSGELERKVREQELHIEWSLSRPALAVEPVRTATRAFITFDTPEEAGDGSERGFTVRRMSKAVQSVGAVGSLDPHKIVTGVMERWNRFNLEVAFRNAWELGDETRDPKSNELIGADCQTIVRYTRLLIKQVGVPGQAEFVVIYGKCTDPGTGIESLDAREHMGRPRQWHNAAFPKASDPARARWAAYLIDGAGGINNYEAALRFTHEGKKKYYPGGVPVVMDGPDQVIRVFTTMSWVDLNTFKVADAIHRYR